MRSYSCSDSRCTNGICFGTAGASSNRRCALPYRNVDSDNNAISYYGLGLNLDPVVGSDNYTRRFSHGGVQSGYRCLFWAFKDQGEALIVMTNGENSWEDSAGNTRGANALIWEIRRSFDNL